MVAALLRALKNFLLLWDCLCPSQNLPVSQMPNDSDQGDRKDVFYRVETFKGVTRSNGGRSGFVNGSLRDAMDFLGGLLNNLCWNFL